jgi:hypothetical protein
MSRRTCVCLVTTAVFPGRLGRGPGRDSTWVRRDTDRDADGVGSRPSGLARSRRRTATDPLDADSLWRSGSSRNFPGAYLPGADGLHLRFPGHPRPRQSEGEYLMNRPLRTRLERRGRGGHLRHDSVEWLVKNVPNNNGRVGGLGISYRAGWPRCEAFSGHPAPAVSPQAPMTIPGWETTSSTRAPSG